MCNCTNKKKQRKTTQEQEQQDNRSDNQWERYAAAEYKTGSTVSRIQIHALARAAQASHFVHASEDVDVKPPRP
jgi:hypothetical protein